MNDLSVWIVLGLSAIVIAETIYLGLSEPDRWLGRAWRKSVGTDRAYRLLTQHNIETDRLIKRGMETLELLEPRMPVQPSDFVVTERGQPLRFEDDPHKGAA